MMLIPATKAAAAAKNTVISATWEKSETTRDIRCLQYDFSEALHRFNRRSRFAAMATNTIGIVQSPSKALTNRNRAGTKIAVFAA